MTWTLGVAPLGGVAPGVGGGGGSSTFDVVVEIALTSGYTTPAASRVWTDITDYVEAQRGLSIQWGRGDQFSTPQPSRLTVTLNNQDGRFTPENASGAYYPNIKKGRPIRVRVRPAGGGYVHRFLGYMDEIPVEWPDGTSSMSTVTITAISRQKRLGLTQPFKSIVEEEYLYDGPVLYWPLGEPQGATTAGNIAPGRSDVLTVTQVGTGGTLVFGQGTGPGTDDLTTPVLTPATSTDGLYLTAPATTPFVASGDHVVELECSFTTSSTAKQILVGLYADPTTYLALYVDDTTGALVAEAAASRLVGSIPVRDGNVHHGVARFSLNDGTGLVTFTLITDGNVETSTAAWPYSTLGGVRYFPAFTRLCAGGAPGGGSLGTSLLTGGLSHVAVYSHASAALSDSRFTQHYNAGANGFTSDASGARVQRYARLAGIPSAEVFTEAGLSGSIAHKDTTGQNPISLMQDVAETEDGVVFDGKDGTLTFHSRSHRYGSSPVYTLDCNAGDIEEGFAPKLDDQHLTNDMTASRPNGITVRSTNDASITEYGYYRESIEILTTSDNEVQARADWEVNRFGTPRVAIPNVRTNLLTSSVAAALLDTDIGTKFRLTNLPSQAPATTADFFVEGGTEQIGFNSYFIEFNVSAAAYANVWQLDSATLSQLDSSTVLAY